MAFLRGFLLLCDALHYITVVSFSAVDTGFIDGQTGKLAIQKVSTVQQEFVFFGDGQLIQPALCLSAALQDRVPLAECKFVG